MRERVILSVVKKPRVTSKFAIKFSVKMEKKCKDQETVVKVLDIGGSTLIVNTVILFFLFFFFLYKPVPSMLGFALRSTNLSRSFGK